MFVCVCVSESGRDGRMDMMVRMRPLTVMCPRFSGEEM